MASPDAILSATGRTLTGLNSDAAMCLWRTMCILFHVLDKLRFLPH